MPRPPTARTLRAPLVALTITTLLLTLGACGSGSGQGLRTPNDPILVASTSLPSVESGEAIDHVIPLSGGCGGPYVINVIEGRLPRGVSIDEENHALTGVLLEDGEFRFTIQVVDSGCDPFSSTTASFLMGVDVGGVVIVDALLDGASSLTPPGSTPENPQYAALPTVVYNAFTTIELVVAGGVGPYSVQVVEDLSNPAAGLLPLGTSLSPNSVTITGAPVEVGPEGGPFVLALEARDAVGGTSRLTVQWKIDTPAIIIATEALAGGVCGEPYSEGVFVAEGVPPFEHELVERGLPDDFLAAVAPDAGDVVYNAGGPPTVTPPEALNKIDETIYPGAATFGPDYTSSDQGAPPEGIRFDEDTGSFTGWARRRGTFRIHYHVQSSLVPDSFGQHNWRTFTVQFAEAPPVGHDPLYTLEDAFSDTPPYANLPPAEKKQPYNPDSAEEPVAGLQLLALGGVAKDGHTDAPHVSQALSIEGPGPGDETTGAYDWTVDLDPDGDGGNDPISTMELLAHSGIWRTTDADALVPQNAQEVEFTVYDEQLPTALRHEAAQTVDFEIGPDVVIVTESTTSYSGTSSSNMPMNDTNMTVRALVPFSGGAQLRNLTNEDLAGESTSRHTIPSTAGSGVTIATLLTGIDILRASVNPTGWWDDLHGLNVRAARQLQHGDRNAYVNYYGMNYNGSTSSSSSDRSSPQPSATSLALPACTSPAVTHDPEAGVYTDGGQLYVFNSTSQFGVFLIRGDSRLYVPAAFDKTTYTNFGDNWNQAYSSGNTHSLVQLPQMTVSPDGRFAALKLRTGFSRFESAGTTKILLLSLTGERPAAWGGATWKVVDTGSPGGSSTGQYQFASSLTLTNRYLYYLIGSGSTTHLSWKDHYVYRYEIGGGASAGAFLHPNADPDWTNTTSLPMQTVFQRMSDSFTDTTNRPDTYMIARHGYNATEVSMAPHPFRVNADGDACAILAGLSTTSTSGSDVMIQHVWVDHDGSLTKLSSTRRRHPRAGGRGYAIGDGPETFPTMDWGARTGPTTAFEISDDGLRVAVVVNRDTSILSGKSWSSVQDWTQREDVIAFEAANGTSWAGGVTEIQVTGDEATPSNAPFSSSTLWRFGALVFTRDGKGLVFYGGFPAFAPNTIGSSDSTYGRYRSKGLAGSLYAYDFEGDDLLGILAAADGGHSDGAGEVYTSTNKVTVTNASWTTTGGVVKPVGGFLSGNGNFLYLVNGGAISSSATNEHQLIGVNIRSLDDTDAINGHDDGRAFLVAGMPSTRGFLPKYAGPWSYYGIGSTRYNRTAPFYYGHYAPGGLRGAGLQVVAQESGRVFFASHWQRSTARSVTSVSTSQQYGGPIHNTAYADYGYYHGHVNVFDANVGGRVHQITGSALGANSGGSSSTYFRPIAYLEVAPDGRSVGFVYGDGSSVGYPREKLAYVGGIDLNENTGELLSGGVYQALVTASNGRLGSAMAFGPTNRTLYYAKGTSNENNKTLASDAFDPAGTPTTTSFAFGARNYTVLHAGR